MDSIDEEVLSDPGLARVNVSRHVVQGYVRAILLPIPLTTKCSPILVKSAVFGPTFRVGQQMVDLSFKIGGGLNGPLPFAGSL